MPGLHLARHPAERAARRNAVPAAPRRRWSRWGAPAKAEAKLNTDRMLAGHGRSGNVVLPMLFRWATRRRPDKPCRIRGPQTARRRSAKAAARRSPARCGQVPIEALGSRAALIGHLNANADIDGGIREPSRWCCATRPLRSSRRCRCWSPPEPQPRAGRRQGAARRGSAPGQAAHPDRQPRRR